MVEIDKDELRKKYPNLWNEINGQSTTLKDLMIEGMQTDKFRGYTPNAIDYLRRDEKKLDKEKTTSYVRKKGEMRTE